MKLTALIINRDRDTGEGVASVVWVNLKWLWHDGPDGFESHLSRHKNSGAVTDRYLWSNLTGAEGNVAPGTKEVYEGSNPSPRSNGLATVNA